jgi:hypothetical protein
MLTAVAKRPNLNVGGGDGDDDDDDDDGDDDDGGGSGEMAPGRGSRFRTAASGALAGGGDGGKLCVYCNVNERDRRA